MVEKRQDIQYLVLLFENFVQNLINKNKDDLYTAFGKLGVFFPNSVEEIILKIKNNV